MSPSVGLQISFLCRLIKLVRHISNYRHLISTGSTFSVSPTKRAPGVSLFHRRLSVTVPKRVCLPLSSLSVCLSVSLSLSLSGPSRGLPLPLPLLSLRWTFSKLFLRFSFGEAPRNSNSFLVRLFLRVFIFPLVDGTMEWSQSNQNRRLQMDGKARLSLSRSPYLLFIFLPRWEY